MIEFLHAHHAIATLLIGAFVGFVLGLVGVCLANRNDH